MNSPGKFLRKWSCLLFVIIVSFVFVGEATAQTWTQLFPTGGPIPARSFHSVVYNSSSNRMIVFGGLHTSEFVFVPPSLALLNDVWVLSNADGTDLAAPAWTQLNPTGTPPSKRTGSSAVYDPANNRMMVFGGNPNLGFCFGTTNDLWLLENADGTGATAPAWTQLTPTGVPPSQRWAHTAGYDAATNRMIIFGGLQNGCGSPIPTDVWVLENANGLDITTNLPATPNWIQLSPAGVPPTGSVAPMNAIYDVATNRLFVLSASSSTSGYDDVRYLSNANGLDMATGLPAVSNWFPVSTIGGSPTAEAQSSIVYDGASNRIIIFGGVFGPDPGGRINEAWVLTNADGTEATPSAWTLLSTTDGPPIGRDANTAIYNPGANRMTVFGGFGCLTGAPCTANSEFAAFNDVWVLTDANGLPANQPPIADAGVDQNIFLTETAVLSGAASSDPDGDPITYMWSIDLAPPGSTAALVGANTVSPSITPDVVGTYRISLVVNDGQVDSAASTVNIIAAQNLPPVAVATGVNTTGFAPLTVNLDASGSNDFEGGPLTYLWDFGDPSSGPANSSNLVNPSHTYATVGNYTAVVLVIDNLGLNDLASVAITVTAPNQPPTVAPTAAPANGTAPLAVQFTANGVDPDNGPAPLTYSWDFGDTGTSSVADPTHTYTSPGAYIATVNASDGEFTATGSITISVGSPLACNITEAKSDEGKEGKVEGKVDIKAHFTFIGLPNPSDLIEVQFDNITLISEPFAAFTEEADEPGVYEFEGDNIHMKIDFNKAIIKVSRHKMVLTDVDNSNGVDVVIYFGNAACTDHLAMEEHEDEHHEKKMSHKEKD